MRYLVSEKKLLIALLFLFPGAFLLSQISLFSNPVVVSETDLALTVLSFVLLAVGAIQVSKAVRKV